MNKPMVFNYNFFTQALCWEYYSKPKNLASYTSNIILSLKVEKKKTPEKS